MDALSQKGCKKALDLDEFCIVGIHYAIAWRWRRLLVCKDRRSVYYAGVWQSGNLVILVSLIT